MEGWRRRGEWEGGGGGGDFVSIGLVDRLGIPGHELCNPDGSLAPLPALPPPLVDVAEFITLLLTP